jgi:hypothetical protein
MKTKQEIDLKLIDLVQNYPQLYDKSNIAYKNQLKKTVVWQTIASELEMQGIFLKYSDIYSIRFCRWR